MVEKEGREDSKCKTVHRDSVTKAYYGYGNDLDPSFCPSGPGQIWTSGSFLRAGGSATIMGNETLYLYLLASGSDRPRLSFERDGGRRSGGRTCPDA